MSSTRSAAFLAALLSLAALMPAPVAASHGIAIWSVSPNPVAPEQTVDVWGQGFTEVTNVYLESFESGCCWGVGWSLVDDGHLTFTMPFLNAGDYTLWAESFWCDEFGCSGTSTSFSFVTVFYPDNDGDGWNQFNDCNDLDWSVHPGASDQPYDGVDQDCDGLDRMPDFRAGFYAAGSGFDDAIVGVQDGATDGFDAGLDAPEPPTSPAGESIRLFTSYPANPLGTERLSTSIVDDNVSVSFPLHVAWSNGPEEGQQISLYWDSWAFVNLPPTFTAHLKDGPVLHDLRACCDPYTFTVSGITGEKDFEVIVGTDVIYQQWVPGGWSLLSLPVAPHEDDVAAVFGGHADVVYAWNGTSYEEVQTVVPGVGYWVHNPLDGATVSFFGQPVRALDVELQPGWNLVGAPIQGASLWSAPGHVSQTAFAWSGGGYWSTTWLSAGLGYWVYSHESSASLHLEFAPNLAVPRDPLALVPEAPESAASELTLALALADTSGAADGATLVAQRGAEDGFDGADVVEAPRPAASAWTQAFFAWRGMEMDVTSVAPVAEEAFDLVVVRQGDAGRVTLAWDAAAIPDGVVAELVHDGARVDMRAEGTYAWDVVEGATTTRLTVAFRPADAPLCAVELDGACLAQLPAVA